MTSYSKNTIIFFMSEFNRSHEQVSPERLAEFRNAADDFISKYGNDGKIPISPRQEVSASLCVENEYSSHTVSLWDHVEPKVSLVTYYMVFDDDQLARSQDIVQPIMPDRVAFIDQIVAERKRLEIRGLSSDEIYGRLLRKTQSSTDLSKSTVSERLSDIIGCMRLEESVGLGIDDPELSDVIGKVRQAVSDPRF